MGFVLCVGGIIFIVRILWNMARATHSAGRAAATAGAGFALFLVPDDRIDRKSYRRRKNETDNYSR